MSEGSIKRMNLTETKIGHWLNWSCKDEYRELGYEGMNLSQVSQQHGISWSAEYLLKL